MLFDMYEYFNREEFPISFSHAAPPSTEHGNEHEQEIPLVDLPGSPV